MTIKLQVSSENNEELVKYIEFIVLPSLRQDTKHGWMDFETYWETNEI